jgi:hypothetical protein
VEHVEGSLCAGVCGAHQWLSQKGHRKGCALAAQLLHKFRFGRLWGNCVIYAAAAGSAGGVQRNFATLVEILGEFAEVAKPQKAAVQREAQVRACSILPRAGSSPDCCRKDCTCQTALPAPQCDLVSAGRTRAGAAPGCGSSHHGHPGRVLRRLLQTCSGQDSRLLGSVLISVNWVALCYQSLSFLWSR